MRGGSSPSIRMVRLSSPISSRLILASSYSAFLGLGLYSVIQFVDPIIHGLVQYIQSQGIIAGITTCSAPFIPFCFIYASIVCPSHITVTDTEIRAKFFGSEKSYPMEQLKSVRTYQTGENEFIVFKIAGKTLKAELNHGAYHDLRKLLPTALMPTT